jgi:hypothetical protein
MEGQAKMRLIAPVTLILMLAAGPAHAQAGDAAAADALFREGRALLKSGDHEAACEKLAESHRLDPAPGTAISLGDCLEKVGRLADAVQAKRDALDRLPPGDRRVGLVHREIVALEKRVPKLTIALAAGAPPGTKVRRGDVELGTGSLGTALPVNPGMHVVTVAARGFADRSYEIILAESETRELSVQPGDATPPPQPRPAAKVSEPPPARHDVEPGSGGSSPTRTAGFVVGGIGLALGAVAVGVQLAAHLTCNKKKEEGGCDEADANRAQTLQGVAITTGIVAGAAFLTGAVLVVIGGKSSSSSAAGSLSLAAGLLPGTAGASGISIQGGWL